MLRSIVLTGGLVLPTVLAAQPMGQPYVGVAGGANFADTMLSTGGTAQVGTAPGPLGRIELGWALDDGLRAEIEGRYGSNSVGNIATLRLNGQRLPLANVDGSLRLPAVMANIAYDITPERIGLKLKLPFEPYVGAGLGYAWLHFSGTGGNEIAVLHLADNNVFAGPVVVNYGSGGAPAYQAFAGASVPLDILPGLAATLEYRFLGTFRSDITATARSTTSIMVNGSIPSASRRLGFEAHDSAVLVGLRYAFEMP